jgi:hypothetical protein
MGIQAGRITKRSIELSRCLQLTVLTVVAASGLLAQSQSRTQTFPLRDSTGLIPLKVKTESVNYLGRKCVRITMDGDDRDGLALLPGTDFQDGVIEADIALKVTVPPGVRYPGFLGIAFRARPDASRYELFYVRPGNANALDQAMRNHAVQYSSEPDYGWYRLRREWPSVYESHADIAMETWIPLRIEVAGRTAKLFLNGSPKPSLVVDGLKGEDLHGAVGLWSFTGEEAYFSNIRITPGAPASLINGSEVAGHWEMQFSTDVGRMGAIMDLHRNGNDVIGTWSGPMGNDRTVTGTWRNGYVELSLAGEWPKEIDKGTPGPANAYLAGWIDGNSGKGRMRVDGRTDGVWLATHKD